MNNTASYELIRARNMMQGWIEAEQAVMTGQEYWMGTRRLRRADLREIGRRIEYWKGEVDALEGNPRIRIKQIIPRDL